MVKSAESSTFSISIYTREDDHTVMTVMVDYLGCLIRAERIVARTHYQQLRLVLLQERDRFGQQHLLVDRPGASRSQGDVEDVSLLASVGLLPFSYGEDSSLVQGAVPDTIALNVMIHRTTC